MENLIFRSLAEHEQALLRGEYSALELLDAYFCRIAEQEKRIGAFLTLDHDRAIKAAREADQRLQSGARRGFLDGIPFAAKDNFCTKDMRTTCASKMLEHYVPPYDATAVERLLRGGCALTGKLNMDEFGMGSSCEHSALGTTRNPHDTARVAGGSSGGAAAAVAAREVPFAIASDTGGSIRQPAAFCGVVGLKPTYGAISRYGLVAFASSLDCVGIIAPSADDCARVFETLIGADGLDATVRDNPFSYVDFEKLIPESVRLGIADTDFESDPDSYVVDKAAVALARKGFLNMSVRLPAPEQALAAYYVISSAEASANLARFDGVRYGHRAAKSDTLAALYAHSRAEGFGEEVKRRILFGTYVLSEGNRDALYMRACAVREQIRIAMLRLLKECDLLLLPTAPTTAFTFGERKTPAEMYASDLCTVYASLAGLPAVSVPYGYDGQGLPRAVQLVARPNEETLLLAVAKLLEEVAK